MHEGAQIAKVVLEPLDIGPKFLAVLGQLLYREVLSLDLRFLYLVTLTEHRVEAHYFQLVLQEEDTISTLNLFLLHLHELLLQPQQLGFWNHINSLRFLMLFMLFVERRLELPHINFLRSFHYLLSRLGFGYLCLLDGHYCFWQWL